MIPRDDKNRLQNTTKLAGMTCYLINKAVMKQTASFNIIIIIIIGTGESSGSDFLIQINYV